MYKRAADVILLRFEISKKEELVFDDGAAHAAAVLFQREGWKRLANFVAEEIVGIP